MSAQSESQPDAPIRVVIAPSQSAYYAGEPFTVSITFTNTRSPDVSASVRSARPSKGHQRNAHSISSAPIAKPPTSPGIPSSSVTPRTAGPSSTSFGAAASKKLPGSAVKRRGLVGGGKPSEDATWDEDDTVLAYGRRRSSGKSLSVDITPRAVQRHQGDPEVSPHSPIMVQRALGMSGESACSRATCIS
jgi:hypothetical protein